MTAQIDVGQIVGRFETGTVQAHGVLREPMPAHTYVSQVELPLDVIEVRERSRLDVGDVASLAASIRERGLLHPPVVRRDGDSWVLVAGERRLEALRQLDYDRTLVTVAVNATDELAALQAEGDENTERVGFTPEEAVRHRRRIEAVVAAEAKERQGTRTDLGQELSGNLPQGSPDQRKTRSVTAKGTGYSPRTLDKAEKVVDAAEDETLPEPVREVAQQARQQMNETGKVDGAARKVREAKDREVIRQATEATGGAADAARRQLRANFARLHHQFTTGLLGLSPEHVAAVIEDDVQWRLIESTRERALAWFDAVLAAKPKPFTVIDGGRDALRLDGAAQKCRRWWQDHNPRVRTAEGGSVKTIGGTRQRDADTGRLGASYEQLPFADMERDQLEDKALKLVRDIDAAQLTLAALGRLLKVMDRVPSARTPREACSLLGTTVEAVMAGVAP